MVLLNYLLGFLLVSSSLNAGERANGWFPVEQSQNHTLPSTEEESNIWVLFSKDLGTEKFSARFPSDPIYRIINDHIFEVSAAKAGQAYLLTVHERKSVNDRFEEVLTMSDAHLVQIERPSEKEMDLIYKKGESWVRESILATPTHLYQLQITGSELSVENFSQFLTSFQIHKSL